MKAILTRTVLAVCCIAAPVFAVELSTSQDSTTASASDSISRATVLEGLRPSVKSYVAEVEAKCGLQAVFQPLSRGAYVVAQYWFDPAKNMPIVSLGKGWQDVDVAHEFTHMKLDLVDGFSVLAWRRGVERKKEIEAAFGRLRCYVDDQVVHMRLVKQGYKLDGEVLKPPLFDSIFTNVPKYLNEGRERKNDGMAHLDDVGCGDLCRATFLIQAELALKFFRDSLSPARVKLAQDFIKAFRTHRAREAEKADKILALFEKYDVMTPAGHANILKEWTSLEGLDAYVGLTAYKRENDRFILPWP
jgi:hypothetical protein